jgi:two-component system sensor kinase FixL
LEQDASKHREQLAHVTRLGTMGEMATGLAHEINQPLAGISTYASACLILLRSADAFPESGKLIDILGKIDVQSRRAGDIIHGLRKLVRKRESVNVPFSMNQAVASALALTESEARSRSIILRCELATDLPDLEGDEIQAEQVILNLVRNAMEAMSESEQHRREILVRTSLHDGHSVVVDVCDTGPGLDAADVEHVFDAFVSTKEAGLGLSISRTIAEAHGGKLWAEPNPDQGVTFRCRFPLPLEVVS